MQSLEVSGAVRLIYRSLGIKGIIFKKWGFAVLLTAMTKFIYSHSSTKKNFFFCSNTDCKHKTN